MKKFLTALIVLTLIGNMVFVSEQISSQTSQYPRNYLTVQLIKTDPVPLQTSEYADVWLKVSNRGLNELENVTIKFEPSYPFSVDPDEETEWDLGTMHPLEEYRVHLQVKVDENAVHGENYFKIYTEIDGTSANLRKIPVQIRTDDAALVIHRINFPDNVAPGTSS